MMGIHFKPGGAYPFFGFPIAELQNSVVELEAIWGSASIGLRDQLLERRDPMGKFRLLAQFLLNRARKPLPCSRAVALALREFEAAPDAQTIRSVAERAGISHKHLIEQFSKWVGLTPKLYCRIRRFQRAVKAIEAHEMVEWADIACASGYYDQAHFIKDFQAFSGLNPSAYLTYRSEYMNFVPIPD